MDFFGGVPPAGGVFDRVLNDVFDSFGGRYAIVRDHDDRMAMGGPDLILDDPAHLESLAFGLDGPSCISRGFDPWGTWAGLEVIWTPDIAG